jgi:hypothetical protein
VALRPPRHGVSAQPRSEHSWHSVVEALPFSGQLQACMQAFDGKACVCVCVQVSCASVSLCARVAGAPRRHGARCMQVRGHTKGYVEGYAVTQKGYAVTHTCALCPARMHVLHTGSRGRYANAPHTQGYMETYAVTQKGYAITHTCALCPACMHVLHTRSRGQYCARCPRSAQLPQMPALVPTGQLATMWPGLRQRMHTLALPLGADSCVHVSG